MFCKGVLTSRCQTLLMDVLSAGLLEQLNFSPLMFLAKVKTLIGQSNSNVPSFPLKVIHVNILCSCDS